MSSESEGLPILRRPIVSLLMCMIASCALVVACYLAWSSIAVGTVAGCGSGPIMDCDHVLQSKYSKVMGYPVSIPAAGLYVVLIGALVCTGSRLCQVRRVAWWLATTVVAAAAFAALWFMYVQVFALHKLCWYCIVVHGCGLVLAGILAWLKPLPLQSMLRLATPGLAAACVLAVLQTQSSDPILYEVTTEFASIDASGEPSESVVFDLNFLDEEDSLVNTSDVFVDGEDAGRKLDTVARLDADTDSLDFPQVGLSNGRFPLHQAADDEVDFVDSGEATETASPVNMEVGSIVPDDMLRETASVPQPLAGSPVFEAPEPSLSPEPQGGADTTKASKPSRYVDFRFAKVKLNVYDWPIVGDPDAPHVLLELFDYTCSHCRIMNVQLEQAQRRYGDQLAILILPVPLHPDCNPYHTKNDPRHADACELARLALSVWCVDRDAFPGFHHWLVSTEPSPSAQQARQYAETLVDGATLKAQLAGARVSRVIAAHASILKQAGGAPLPRTESVAFSLKGKTNTAGQLFQTLEDKLGMRP